MIHGLPDDWYIEATGESRILDQHKVAAEIAQLRESNSRVAAVAEQRLREIERLTAALANACRSEPA
jgi:5-enolpyruvylshikimate-3-phosphate synthase